MKCPCCNHANHLEIDLHADGFSSNLIECNACGALLITAHHKLEVIRNPDLPAATNLAYAQ